MASKPLSHLMVFAFILTFSTTFSRIIPTSNVVLASLSDVDSQALAPDVAEGPTASADDDFGFIPLDTKDPKVIELAKFAIDQYNKEHKSNLVYSTLFEAIISTKAQGTEYELVIAASNNGDLNDYTANLLFYGDDKTLVIFQENE